MTPLPFADATALTPLGEGRFAGDVSDRWTIVGKPNGGYLLAMLGRAATITGAHPHVLAASAHYLRSPDPGPVLLEVEELRRGRSASQYRARLLQERRLLLRPAAGGRRHRSGNVFESLEKCEQLSS